MNSPRRSLETVARNLSATRLMFTCLLLLVIILSQLSPALVDGKVFSSVAVQVPVKAPDQRALIHYSNGVERLVIETSFIGQGTNFAWVVPLPSVPTMEPVSEYFFKRLAVSFQPEFHFRSEHEWIALLVLGMIVLLGMVILRHQGASGCLLFLIALVLLVKFILPNFVKARSAGLMSSNADGFVKRCIGRK